MALSIPYPAFTAGTTIFSAQVNSNSSAISTWANSHEAAATGVHGVGAGDIVGTANTQTFTGVNTFNNTTNFVGNVNCDSGTLFVNASNNRVGIGTTSPQYDFHLDKSGIAALSVYGTPTGIGPFTTESSKIIFNTRRGTTASPTTVQLGDNLGQITWNGYDGSDYYESAAIRCYASTISGASSAADLTLSTGSGYYLTLAKNGNAAIPTGSHFCFDGITTSPTNSIRVGGGDLYLKSNGHDALRVVGVPFPNDTSLEVRINVGGVYGLTNVRFGAPDSGGAGKRMLVIDN